MTEVESWDQLMMRIAEWQLQASRKFGCLLKANEYP